MRRWIVENTTDDWDKDWNEIVFAENYKDAKKKATHTNLCETRDDFLNLRVKRYPDMDDTENLNRKDYTYKLWQSGWMWESAHPLAPYDEYDDEHKARLDFLKWYSKYYKESESNEID